MKRRFFSVVPMLMGAGWLFSGCTTTGPSIPTHDPNRPQTFLSGADAEQAKSVAMGSAVSKGWKIVESPNNSLLVERPLTAADAESAVGEPVSTASVEVETDFYERPGGVDVVVAAAVVANKGTDAEKRIDFTSNYRDILNRSLDSLRQSWEENRWRVASATPPLPTKDVIPADAGVEGTPAAVEGDRIANSTTPSVPGDATADTWTETTVPAAAPVTASSSAYKAAPVVDRYTVAAPPPITASTPQASPANNMLVLNRSADAGVWAYYAEHYARIRGCEVSDSGAVLERKQQDQEIHRVYCENGQSFQVACNAGTCRGIQ